jgi:hypothetical protein
MSKEITIITVHGMGDTNPNYHHNLQSKLRRYVGKDLWDDKVHLESVFFQKHLQNNQEDYWNEIDDKYRLNWDFLRKFMLYSFSDAASIEHSLRSDLVLYKNVHREIAMAFDNALTQMGDPNKPVIVIAHSLGGEQVANYIWDAMNNLRYFEDASGSDDEKEFRKLKTCKKLITTGCNIPIFRAALDNPQVFERPNNQFVWDNYFDDHDVLAYPLKELSEFFNVPWIVDKNVKVGGLLTAWNPASHGEYWTDRDVVKPIAQTIKELIT